MCHLDITDIPKMSFKPLRSNQPASVEVEKAVICILSFAYKLLNNQMNEMRSENGGSWNSKSID